MNNGDQKEELAPWLGTLFGAVNSNHLKGGANSSSSTLRRKMPVHGNNTSMAKTNMQKKMLKTSQAASQSGYLGGRTSRH